MNWSQMNVWAPARRFAATIRGRMAHPHRVPRRKFEPGKAEGEPAYNHWHEYEPIRADQTHSRSVQTKPSDRVSAWRRRVLLRKGARSHSKLGERASRCSLAILDEFGMVVAWYDRCRSTSSDEVVGKHLTEFYIPTDVANAVPAQHLSASVIDGSNTRTGWRLHVDGRVYWGTTVITPIVMRDGRLQGYMHLTEESQAPWGRAPLTSIRSRLEAELHAKAPHVHT